MDYRKAFDAVSSDPRYLANLDWGEARPGHPEGTVCGTSPRSNPIWSGCGPS